LRIESRNSQFSILNSQLFRTVMCLRFDETNVLSAVRLSYRLRYDGRIPCGTGDFVYTAILFGTFELALKRFSQLESVV
jgi:hypothetical protein